MGSDAPPPPPPPPPPTMTAGDDHQSQTLFKMEIVINRKGEAEVKTTPFSGSAPFTTLHNNPNLEHVTDDRWKALFQQFVDQQRRTGTLPDDEAQHELHLWYLHAVKEYGNNRSHRKSTLSKYQVLLLEEEAGFAFPRSAPPAASANQVQEGKTEAGTKSSSGGGAGNTGGGSSPRIRIKIPKVGAASGMGSNNSSGGLGSNTSSRRSTPKGLTPMGSTPKITDTPMDVDEDASFPSSSVAPETLIADDLPIAGVTMTTAQCRALEATPTDAATMAVLVRRFAKLLARQQYERNAAVNLDHATTLLGAPKNRMIEIVEILEGIGLVELTNGEEGGNVECRVSEGMLEQTDINHEGSEGGAAKKRKREDADTLREEISKLYHEESVLDAWIHRCEALPHYTDRPFLYCKAGDIVRLAQKGPDRKAIEDVATMAIRAPPGGVLEVADPDQTNIGSNKRRYQLSVTNKTDIAALPLPPPPVADSSFDAAKFKASLQDSKIDMGETCGVGGISGNPIQVYHLSGSRASVDANAMDLGDEEGKPPITLRNIDVHTNLKGSVVGPGGIGVGNISGLVTPEMIMNAHVRHDSDTLCLREYEGASTFFA